MDETLRGAPAPGIGGDELIEGRRGGVPMGAVKMGPGALRVRLDAGGRPLELSDAGLGRFFHPKRVAVVGASDQNGRPNTGVTRLLKNWADHVGASLLPVHPTRSSVFGVPCIPSISALPNGIDVVAILVADASDAIGQCAGKEFGFAVVFAAGFAEVGPDGRLAQERLAESTRASGMRLLGPNTNLNAFEQFREDLEGPAIALISQSGHQGRPIFQAQELGIRLSYWAPTGNEADLEIADFIRYFAEQPETGAIAVYAEGFKDGRTILLAADYALERRVPIVMVKVGRTAAGRSMAASHTGKLSGLDAVTDAALAQFGVVRVDSLDQLADTSQLLARARPPMSDGVVVYSISGGTGAHMADICAMEGLRLPELNSEVQEELWQWIPRYLRVSNPVDCGGHPVMDWRSRRILETLLADPDVGVLVVPITGAVSPMSDRLAEDLVAVAEESDKLICVIWGSPVGTEAAYRNTLLGSKRIAVFRTFTNCARALRAYFGYHEFATRYTSPFTGVQAAVSPERQRTLATLAQRSSMSEYDSAKLLARYGLPILPSVLCLSAQEALEAAASAGYPVVLKACGPAIAHKSDFGLVRLGLNTPSEVAAAYEELTERVQGLDVPGGYDGILVAPLIDGGVEMVVGLSRDPTFGPTVMVGLGGTMVEILDDVAIRIPPFDRDEAQRMVRSLRGYPLLSGARGRPKADVDALIDAVMALQKMGLEVGDLLSEVEVNPLLVRAAGQGAIALDALVLPSHTTR